MLLWLCLDARHFWNLIIFCLILQEEFSHTRIVLFTYRKSRHCWFLEQGRAFICLGHLFALFDNWHRSVVHHLNVSLTFENLFDEKIWLVKGMQGLALV